jgi:hypothetical protein
MQVSNYKYGDAPKLYGCKNAIFAPPGVRACLYRLQIFTTREKMSASVIDVTGIDVFFSLVNILAKWR